MIADRGDEAEPVYCSRDVFRGAEIERDGLLDEERQLVLDREAFAEEVEADAVVPVEQAGRCEVGDRAAREGEHRSTGGGDV